MALRILHCISSVNPAGGGPIEALKQLHVAYLAKGHSLEVACLDAPSAPWVQSCPLVVHALGPKRLGKWSYSQHYTPWLRANAHRFDLVIIDGLWQYQAFGAWRALKGSGTPYMVFTHGMLDPWFKQEYPLKHLKKWLFWPWADYRVLRDAKAVLFTCEEEKLRARQSFWLYRCREFVTAFGTRHPPGDVQTQRQAFHEKHPELAGKKLLLFLGRVHEKKGADTLFRAFAEVARRRAADTADVQLVMAGPADHEYGLAMQALATRLGLGAQTTWTGMLQGDLKWGAFRAADAFILPSHQENFGIAVAEALACQVPVLISTQVNIWREITDAQGGYAEDDSQAGTERLIEQWLDTPASKWQSMRGHAAACFEKHFLIDKTPDSLLEALNT